MMMMQMQQDQMMNQPVAIVTTTQNIPGYGGNAYAPPQYGQPQQQYGQP